MAVSWLESWLKNKWVHHSLKLAFALLITILLSPFKLDVFEYMSYDMRLQLSPRPKPSGNVVLLSIEHETLRKLKREPEALDWAVVMQKLAQAKPAHIVSFINPFQIQGSYDDLSMLADIASRTNFVFGENDLPKTGLSRLEQLAAPFERVPVLPAPKTADRTVLSKDGVTRRLILTFENQFTMHPRLAQTFNGIKTADGYKGDFPFLDTTQMLIRFRGKGEYKTLKFIDLMEGNLDPELVRGKIVLIGKDTMEAAADYVTSPLDKGLLALSQLEMHANILDTLILNQAPRFTPEWVKFLFTFLISLLTIVIVLSARPGKGLLMLASSVLVFLLFSLVMFATLSWILPVAHPLVAVFICYYFVIPYRLIIENRRSWEHYQKNRLLTLVDEMKSNFMRMMSHDLKTPLARIQGMAEIIGKDEGGLNPSQRKALDTIADSSEELIDFIGSILSLSRIEAKDMKLNLRSRDINSILREVVRRTDFMAQRKNIEIQMELEPLFSMKVDEDLLKTVLTNLVENAIKYSPENSKILVTTDEADNEVVVQIADQGRGIPREDLHHIFERFYRARNSRTSTAGNGIGLFLAKYFIELHNGAIEVESELDKGSTFTVRLPMNLGQEMDINDSHGERSGGLNV